ncbi:hypothetical protein CAPTEDRAFT_205796 [Capitella teleta]|uniref:Uncharacterized protein n=1 Tax=Capitella teleta TaxID=283909 RepID=R7UBN8_CAPTE|nr:hypothetical protein CAPTEDRAFT_205796 [Capitella teleta]|eukprot:ELU01218.1 hypothetical protein CAPTEDRAFT_205796 [Capitella teleta]
MPNAVKTNRFTASTRVVIASLHAFGSGLPQINRRLEAGRSPCNKTQQLSSFESEQEHGKRRCTPPSTLKIMTLTGLDLCPESSRWTCRCPQHIQPRKEKDLEEDASFHRPAPVVSEDED